MCEAIVQGVLLQRPDAVFVPQEFDYDCGDVVGSQAILPHFKGLVQ